MNILLAGLLGRYADRVLALKRRGHQLVYCTMPPPAQRPLADDLKDPTIPEYILDRRTAGRTVARIVDKHQIDVVYSMKNVWDGSLELVAAMLDAGVGPIVRHYKEHFLRPDELERRSLTETAGQIYINAESYAYFRQTYQVSEATAHILDTDYLPARYLTDDFHPKLSDLDGRPHVVLAGGVSVTGGRNDARALITALADRRIHVHLYGRKYVGPNAKGVWVVGSDAVREAYEALTATGYVHLHDHIEPSRFVPEWSRFDAGLMHVNAADTHDAPFQRMNYPNRLAPYLAAGLPVAQQIGGQDAMERLVRQAGIGFLYHDYAELADLLHDRVRLRELTDNVLKRRHEFSYEHHVDELVDILRRYARPGGVSQPASP